MNDAERAQLLTKLLARVRQNAEARPPPGSYRAIETESVVLLERPVVIETESELRAWPAAGERTSFPDQPEMTEDEGEAIARRIDLVRPMRRSSRPPRGTEPLVIAERGVRSRLQADRWSVLLDDDAEAPMASFASEVPPPPANPNIEEKWRDDREPEGALERAVQNAAHERASQRGAIWIDLVAELRERRGPTSRPAEPEPAPVLVEIMRSSEESDAAPLSTREASTASTGGVDAVDPVGDAFLARQGAPRDEDEAPELPLSNRPSAPPVARSLSPSPYAVGDRPLRDTLRPAPVSWTPHPSAPNEARRSAPPSSLSAPQRRLRRRAQRWSYAKRLVTPRSGRFPAAARAIAIVAAAGIVAVVMAVIWIRNPQGGQGPASARIDATPTTSIVTQSKPPPVEAPTAPTSSGAPSASAVASAPPVNPEASLTPEEGAPADTPSLPETSGYLFVTSPNKIPVYLNGVLAGETQRWMRVGCGWRYLRLAHRGSPPVGSSFPVWATEGRSVLVPCRGATRIELAEDPL